MENMENFYKLLEVSQNASNDMIMKGYKNKISNYIYLNNLTSNNIKEIKALKTALYILTNNELREKYNVLIKQSENTPVAVNHDDDNNLDSVFNIDNSWMKEANLSNKKKDGVDSNLLGERVFSLPSYNKNQNNLSYLDSDIRKPIQGREDKTQK